MKINKQKFLKFLLVLGGLFYLIGAVVHFFGLSVFPFYDHKLFSVYHDSLLALCSFVMAIFMFVIAKDPVKNRDTLNVVLFGVLLASIFSFLIIYRVDFVTIGVPEKGEQTLVEGGLGLIYFGLLYWARA